MTKEEIFAANLRYLMKKHNLTPVAFARKMHLSESAVYSWRSAKETPNINNLCRLAEFFNLKDISDLYTPLFQQAQQLPLQFPKPEKKVTTLQVSAKAKDFFLSHIRDIEIIANNPEKVKQFERIVMNDLKINSDCLDEFVQSLLK